MPLPKVRAVGENEVFKVVKTGKSRSKACRVFYYFINCHFGGMF